MRFGQREAQRIVDNAGNGVIPVRIAAGAHRKVDAIRSTKRVRGVAFGGEFEGRTAGAHEDFEGVGDNVVENERVEDGVGAPFGKNFCKHADVDVISGASDEKGLVGNAGEIEVDEPVLDENAGEERAGLGQVEPRECKRGEAVDKRGWVNFVVIGGFQSEGVDVTIDGGNEIEMDALKKQSDAFGTQKGGRQAAFASENDFAARRLGDEIG